MSVNILMLIISLAALCVILVYRLWFDWKKGRPWNSFSNVGAATIIFLVAGYSFKIEVFSTLGLGCFLGLTFILIRDIKKRVLKPGDFGLFIANMLMLLVSIPQIHLIVCSAC
ncbi:hypothetical protein [Methanothermobacter wolfeii]|uniref:hypothetical protein n=1 Tax=Methanothermobacter TaxID=145260 RepID=UPI0024B3676C|nr:hypothetical protein [Methanothermobacter wolfeii]MDI6703058.1 hypothetical protein [Methanothermobacter wolfeii]MDI6841393.1 hypothetical protein [Methanothermobacter wolfeii]